MTSGITKKEFQILRIVSAKAVHWSGDKNYESWIWFNPRQVIKKVAIVNRYLVGEMLFSWLERIMDAEESLGENYSVAFMRDLNKIVLKMRTRETEAWNLSP